MGTAIINRFDNGIVNDPRDTTNGSARVVSNFDVNTSPRRLIPYRSSVDGNSNSSNDQMQNWCMALRTGTTYSLYGVGRQTASNKVRIFYKDITTGSANDLDDNAWTETANNLATQTTPNYNLFIYYKNQALIYGLHNGYIYTYDPTGSASFGDTHQALTYTNACQGVVHSKDDVLYFGYDNKIASKNGAGAWNLTALTLPAQYYITSICEYNNFIAIAAAPLSGSEKSRVFIWDRSSTLTTITESIDWGYGVIRILEELDGYLVGISALSSTIGSLQFNERVSFRYYTGAGSSQAIDLLSTAVGTGSISLPLAKQKINNRVNFLLKITLNGAVRDGVWSFGINSQGKFTLVHERTSNNDTALGNGSLLGFFYAGEYLFIGFITTGGVYTVSKTNDQPVYSATSIYESQINPNMPEADKPLLKQITGIRLTYNTLSAVNGQVVLKYKTDSASSYTTIFTSTVTGLQSVEFGDAAGVSFSQGREFEFRIESTLGADIINCGYNYQVIPT